MKAQNAIRNRINRQLWINDNSKIMIDNIDLSKINLNPVRIIDILKNISENDNIKEVNLTNKGISSLCENNDIMNEIGNILSKKQKVVLNNYFLNEKTFDFWSNCLKSNSNLKSISLSQTKVEATRTIYDLFKHNTNLEELSLANTNVSSTTFNSILSSFKLDSINLSMNNLQGCNILKDMNIRNVDISNTSIGFNELRSINSNIKHLDISGNNIGFMGIRHLQSNKFETLMLSGCTIEQEGCRYLSNLTPSLKALDLRGNNIKTIGLNFLNNADRSNLTTLGLSCNSIDDTSMPILNDIIKGSPILNTLDISYNSFTNEAVNKLTNIEKLNSLKLKGNILLTDGLIKITDFLKNIESLDISECMIDNVGLEYLLSNCGKIKNLYFAENNCNLHEVNINKLLELKELDLQSSGINDISLISMLKNSTLINLNTINYLCLKNNQISNIGLEYLISYIKSNSITSPIEIDLSFNNITNKEYILENNTLINLI